MLPRPIVIVSSEHFKMYAPTAPFLHPMNVVKLLDWMALSKKFNNNKKFGPADLEEVLSAYLLVAARFSPRY